MSFNNIKKILRKQVEKEVKTFWIYNKFNREFIQIYRLYSNDLTIYTPKQLLDYLNEIPVQNMPEKDSITQS